MSVTTSLSQLVAERARLQRIHDERWNEFYLSSEHTLTWEEHQSFIGPLLSMVLFPEIEDLVIIMSDLDHDIEQERQLRLVRSKGYFECKHSGYWSQLVYRNWHAS